jgi:concanavalin A-like lectin/glucanase superfamily protein
LVGNSVQIGGDPQGRLFNGTIDEVRIYNRALAASEITALYTATNQSAAAWAYRYFGDATVNWDADVDGDGATLWAEYAFGGQPLIADAQLTYIIPQLTSNQLQIIYNRRIANTDELVYQLQCSSDLRHWTLLAGSEDPATPSATLPGFEQVVFHSDIDVSTTPALFVRLAAQVP